MNDHFDDLVRRALAREADKVQPNPYGLERIRARLHAPARRQRSWLLPTAAAVLGTAAAVGAFAVLTNGSQPTSEGPATAENTDTTGPAPTTAPTTGQQSSAPESTGVQTSGTPQARSKPTTVPVYWLGDTVGNPAAGVRLYRTFLGVTGDPVLGAVRAMTEGQSGDPDYSSGWTGAQVASVDVSSTAIAVDFSRPPTKGLGSQAAQVAAQELVYTVQGAVSITGGAHADAPVVVTVDGKPADLWGSVDTSKPISRAPANDVQAFIWITAPAEGATVSSPVEVSGVANTFEATVNWRVRDATTKAVVHESHTQATAGTGTFGTFTFSVLLPAGRYVVECLEFSAADGHETNTDTKSVTVR
ncbi:MAG TPA: Gmad2 immunoglobulin-like domain-containing protein [Kribbellaceae bacterium]|jgi:hypothetical protein